MIVFSKVNLEVFQSGQRIDIEQIDSGWMPHFNTANYEGNWTVLPLRTPGGLDSILPDDHMDRRYADHPNMTRFPAVKYVLNYLQCDIMSVRLLRLSSGSAIKRHTDPELAFERGEARLHIPIITNPKVEFNVNGIRVVMKEGECWYINANLPHSVANNGETDRIHLVVDCKVNPWLSKLILSATVTETMPDHDPDTLLQMIAGLKQQDNPAAAKLVKKFQEQYDRLIENHA